MGGRTAVRRDLDRAATVRRRPHRGRRRALWTLLGLTAIVLGLAGISAVPALRGRDALESGRSFLTRAQDRLLEGDVAAAGELFGRAGESFASAARSASNPLVGIWVAVPLAGRSYDALRDLARIGELVSAAGRDVTAAVERLPGGLAALAPSAGSIIRIDAATALDPAVAAAAAKLRLAASLARGLPETFVPSQVSSVAAAVRAQIEPAAHAATAAEAILRALPSFAGAEGPRRYFVAVQNPAELRGTGGFIGSYSILTIDRAAVSLGPFRDIANLGDVPVDEISAPPGGFGHLYDAFGGAGFWRNINMAPDAPAVGSAIEALYRRVEGVHLDGMIFVDPAALADMVGATGPILDPRTGIALSAEQVVPFMTNEAYSRFAYDARKRALGSVATAIFERFLQGTDPVAAIRALAGAAARGDLVLHSADPQVQAAFDAAGVAGSLGTPSGDYLGVFLDNAAGNKVDYYLDERLAYSVTLGEGGGAAAEATVRLANGAPAGQPPSEVLGPYGANGLEAGDTLWWVETFCARTCALGDATLNGGPGSVEPLHELGMPMFRSFVRADAGRSATLGYRFDLLNAWHGDDTGGTYRLTLQAQPTVRPVRGQVTIRVPPGMNVVETSAPMRVDDGVAVWSGTVEGKVTIWIRFERPFLERVWTRLWDVLTPR
jgi:hypothetical protein